MNTEATKHSASLDASEVVELLRNIEERLAAAWVEGDRPFIEVILADDWSVTDVTGRVLKKAEVLEEAFGSKDRQIVSMRIDEISVRPFEGWAIVTGRTHAAGDYNRGVAYWEIGQMEDALKDFDSAVPANPVDPIPLVNKGDVLKRLNEYQHAVETYTQAIESKTMFPFIVIELTHTLK